MATETERQGQAAGVATADDFQALLKQNFKPRTERAATEIENAVTTLVQQALADQNSIKDDVLDTITQMIAAIDKKISDQMNEIIHNEEFQKLESSWREIGRAHV